MDNNLGSETKTNYISTNSILNKLEELKTTPVHLVENLEEIDNDIVSSLSSQNVSNEPKTPIMQANKKTSYVEPQKKDWEFSTSSDDDSVIEDNTQKISVTNNFNSDIEDELRKNIFSQDIDRKKLDDGFFTPFYYHKYDGTQLFFYNRSHKIINQTAAIMYTGSIELKNNCGGTVLYTSSNNKEKDMYVLNPSNAKKLIRLRKFEWLMVQKICELNKYKIFTKWAPVYCTTKKEILEAIEKEEKDIVIPNTEIEGYRECSLKTPLIPLHEIILHLYQEYFNMTLVQIAVKLETYYNPDFFDIKKVMKFLFENFRSSFESLCITEIVPLHELHESNFNITFGHFYERKDFTKEITISKALHNVYVKPYSNLFASETYGNIPWIVGNLRQTRDDNVSCSHQKCVFYNGPLGFFNSKIAFEDKKEPEHFLYIIVFKALEYDSKIYPQGAMMGLVAGDDGSQDIIFRGEIFESMSVREQLILTSLFQVFIVGDLKSYQKFTKSYATLPLTLEQQRVRNDFIRIFQDELFNTEKSG